MALRPEKPLPGEHIRSIAAHQLTRLEQQLRNKAVLDALGVTGNGKPAEEGVTIVHF